MTILCPASFNSWLIFTSRVHLFEVFMQWRLLLACLLEQCWIIKLISGSEFEENERKNVALRFNDWQIIYFVIFPSASKSSMNFHNLKLPVQGKSQVFKLLHSSREIKAQKNTFIGSKGKPDCLVNLELP